MVCPRSPQRQNKDPKIRTPAVVLPAAAVLVFAAPLLATAVPASAAPPADTGAARYIVQYAAGADLAAEVAGLRGQGLAVGRTFSHAVRAAVVTANPAQATA
jgi:hypothetical protein